MMKQEVNYYAIIPAEVRYSDLKANAKLMYGEITALSNKHGYCFASNNYFSELYGVSKNTISIWINDLVRAGFINSDIIKTSRNQVKERRISLTKKIEGSITKKDEDNITSNNTTSNNISLRQMKFANDVSLMDYPNDIKKEFESYWTETNKSKTKMRFELERTFDIKRRLQRWIKNNERWGSKSAKKSNVEQALSTHQKARDMMNSIISNKPS